MEVMVAITVVVGVEVTVVVLGTKVLIVAVTPLQEQAEE